MYGVSGLIIGHLYIFLKEILPVSHRKYYLDTPFFMNKAANWFLAKLGEANPNRNINNNR